MTGSREAEGGGNPEEGQHKPLEEPHDVHPFTWQQTLNPVKYSSAQAGPSPL